MKIDNMELFSCKQATYLSIKRQETKLSFGEKIALKFHLSLCDACCNFDRQSKIIDSIVTKFIQKLNFKLPEEKKKELEELIHNNNLK